jgi:hypothetical protein
MSVSGLLRIGALILIIVFCAVDANLAFGQDCDAILSKGITNTYQELRSKDLRRGFRDAMCSTSNDKEDNKTDAGLSVTVPIYGVPVSFGGNYGQVTSSARSSGLCRDTSSALGDKEFESVMVSAVAPQIVEAWSLCKSKQGGLFVNGDLNGRDLVLEFRFRPYGSVYQTKVEGNPVISGATCPNPIVNNGTIIDNGSKFEKCERLSAGAVTVIVNSKVEGAKFFIPPAPTAEEIATKLVGEYDVWLGKNGGCGGAKPDTHPSNRGHIIYQGTALMAINECGETSYITIIDPSNMYWWGGHVSITMGQQGVVLKDAADNTWQKGG